MTEHKEVKTERHKEQKLYKEAARINKEEKDRHAKVENGKLKIRNVLKG